MSFGISWVIVVEWKLMSEDLRQRIELCVLRWVSLKQKLPPYLSGYTHPHTYFLLSGPEKKKKIFDLATAFYMLLWSRHLATLRKIFGTGLSLGKPYPSVEMQLEYSTAKADKASNCNYWQANAIQNIIWRQRFLLTFKWLHLMWWTSKKSWRFLYPFNYHKLSLVAVLLFFVSFFGFLFFNFLIFFPQAKKNSTAACKRLLWSF